jgi:hypothetical protein
MIFSKKLIDEFKCIFKEKYNVEYTDEEAQEAANNLAGLVEIILRFEHKNRQRHKRLEKEPDGFYLEDDGIYNCLVCHKHIQGKEGWWDEYGQKCLDCQRNVTEGVIPPEICQNRDLWWADWELKDKFGIFHQTAKKMRRLGELRGRELKNKSGNVYFTLYLKNENSFLIKERNKTSICKKSGDNTKKRLSR